MWKVMGKLKLRKSKSLNIIRRKLIDFEARRTTKIEKEKKKYSMLLFELEVFDENEWYWGVGVCKMIKCWLTAIVS